MLWSDQACHCASKVVHECKNLWLAFLGNQTVFLSVFPFGVKNSIQIYSVYFMGHSLVCVSNFVNVYYQSICLCVRQLRYTQEEDSNPGPFDLHSFSSSPSCPTYPRCRTYKRRLTCSRSQSFITWFGDQRTCPSASYQLLSFCFIFIFYLLSLYFINISLTLSFYPSIFVPIFVSLLKQFLCYSVASRNYRT